MFNQNVADAKAFIHQSNRINEGVDVFVSSDGKYEFTDWELWDFPDDTPCEWILADEKTYNKLAGHEKYLPFDHKDGIAMMVIIAPGSLTIAAQLHPNLA